MITTTRYSEDDSHSLGHGACLVIDFGADAEVAEVNEIIAEKPTAAVAVATPAAISGHPDAEAWADRSGELSEAALGLLNRTDCCGGYFGKRPTTHKQEYNRTWQPMPEALRQHFAGGRVIGLHTTSLGNTCGWMVFDFDAHEDVTNANMKPALELAARILAIGLTPYIFDSNGKGGLHVWCVFPRARKTRRVYDLANMLAGGFDCEAFPKQPRVEPDRFGNWVRLPGKHYKRNHWSRLLTPQGWASAGETIDAVIEMCGKGGA